MKKIILSLLIVISSLLSSSEVDQQAIHKLANKTYCESYATYRFPKTQTDWKDIYNNCMCQKYGYKEYCKKNKK